MKIDFRGKKANNIPACFKPFTNTQTYNKVSVQPPVAQKTEKRTSNNTKLYSYLAMGAALAAGAGIIYAHKAKNNPLKELKNLYKDIIKQFPGDENYYKNIAKALSIPKGEEYKLVSIVGENQLTSILQNATKKDFTVSKDMLGIKNRTLRINLHTHTTASDGKLSPFEILEQARKWADDVSLKFGKDNKPPFVLAITDHDTMDGAKEAVKIITKNPKKYKNLKLVLGGEFSVTHTDPKDVVSPMNFELLGYSLNPFNKKLNNFLQEVKVNRTKVVEEFIQKVKKQFPNYDLNMEDIKDFHSNLNNMRTNGVLYLTREYLEHKIIFTHFVEEINKKIIPQNFEPLDATKLFRSCKDRFYETKDATGFKNNPIVEFYKDYFLTPLMKNKNYLTSENKTAFDEIFKKDFKTEKDFIENLLKASLPKLDDTRGYFVRHQEFFKVVKETEAEGFFGVAHPGLINASMFSKEVENFCNQNGYDKGQHLAWRLYKSLKDTGGIKFKATEANYQSYPYNDHSALNWQKYMGPDKAEEFNLLKTGGIDCHKPSIFKKHKRLTEDEIRNNNLAKVLY